MILGPGIEEGIIRLGALLPLSGALASQGQAMLAGQEAYWGYVNSELGGVGGLEIQLIPGDNAYQLEGTEAALADMKDEVLAISANLGSPITEAVIPTARAEGLLVAAGSQVSAWGTEPSLLLDLALASYRDQIAVGLAEARQSGTVREGGLVGIMAQDGFYGDDCLAGYSAGVAAEGLADSLQLRVSNAQTEFSGEVAAAQAAAVELLVLCTIPEATLSITGTAALSGYEPRFLATAQAYDQGLPAARGGDEGESAGLAALAGVSVLGAIEQANDTSPGLRLYNDNLARGGLDARTAGWYTYFGYTQAATFHLVLSEALAAGDLSRQGLRDAVGRLGEVDFGFGAGPVAYDSEGVPSRVDAVGAPVAEGEAAFGVQRISEFVRLDS